MYGFNSVPSTIGGIPLNGLLLPSSDQAASAIAASDQILGMMRGVPVVEKLVASANMAQAQSMMGSMQTGYGYSQIPMQASYGYSQVPMSAYPQPYQYISTQIPQTVPAQSTSSELQLGLLIPLLEQLVSNSPTTEASPSKENDDIAFEFIGKLLEVIVNALLEANKGPKKSSAKNN